MRVVTVSYQGEEARITVIDPIPSIRFSQLIKDGEVRPIAYAEALELVTIDWDITDNGEPYPPTVENIAILPMDLIAKIMTAISDGSSPSFPSFIDSKE